MVNFISSWSEQIILAVIITTILEMLLPNGKSKKYIKTIIGIYVLFCIISPFVNMNEVVSVSEYNLEKYLNLKSENNKIDSTLMDKRLQELYIKQLEKDIIKIVNSYGYDVKTCNVDAELIDENNAGIKKIEIKIKSKFVSSVEKVEVNVGQVIDDKNVSVGKEEIENLKKKLAEHYQINKDFINIK